MEMPKPTDADRERFQRLVPDDPRVETRPMFGNVAAFVNGNMFMGLLGSDVGVRLDEATLDEVKAMEGAGPFGPPDKPMREYVRLPPALRDDPAAAAGVLAKALDYVGGLPPKEKKPGTPPNPTAQE